MAASEPRIAEFLAAPERRRHLERQGLLSEDGKLLSRREAERRARDAQRAEQAARNARRRAAMEAETQLVCRGGVERG